MLDLNNQEQQNLLRLLRGTNQNLFLTGKAGTGKSTLLRYIMEETDKKFVALAPTGIAALNINGQTIHSFFKLPLGPIPYQDPIVLTRQERKKLEDLLHYSQEQRKMLGELELIIIDEVSMVRADVIDIMDRALRFFRGRYREPFGGVQMLFVGDLYQLGPVIKADEEAILRRFYDSLYFFGAKVFSSSKELVTIELQKVYRQGDLEFVRLLDRFRVSDIHPADLKVINSRVDELFAPPSNELVLTLHTTRGEVSQTNQKHLDQIEAPSVQLVGSINGDFSESLLPTDLLLTLKEGAQVMFITNDMERPRRWINGSIGVVEHISEDGEEISVRLDDGSIHKVEPYTWENIRYTYEEDQETKKGRIEREVIGSFTQLPLRLAWAVTIHKSQGLTFEKVIIDLGRGSFSAGQTYVALSRCRSLEGITLKSQIKPRDFIPRKEIDAFYAQANNETAINQAFTHSEALEHYVFASKAWGRKQFAKAIRSFRSAVERDNLLGHEPYLRLLCQKALYCQTQEERIQQQKEEIERLQSKLSSLAKEQCLMAEQSYQLLNDTEIAISAYDRAISLDPRCVEAYVGRGKMIMKREDSYGARSDLDKALKLSPNYIPAHLAMAELLLGLGLSQEAVYHLEAVARQDAKHREMLSLLLQLYEQEGDAERAKQIRSHLKKLTKTDNPPKG